MNVVLYVGSPRKPSNTRSIVSELSRRLREMGHQVRVLDAERDKQVSEDFVAESKDALRAADALVIAAPVYLDLPPHRTLSWLHAIWMRRDEMVGHRLAVYGISHSGYFEPAHKQVSIEAMAHFCRRMGWSWMGALAFGGTSPIDGRKLEDAGPFSLRPRKTLPQLAICIVDGRPIDAKTSRDAERRPIPLPRRLIVWMMNWVLQREERKASG